MKRLILLCLVSILCFADLRAQDNQQIQETFNGESLTEILTLFENLTEIRIYFDRSRTDSVHYSGVVNEVDIEKALEKVFEGTQFSYFRDADGILFVTEDITIIETPRLAQLLGRNETDASFYEEGLLFKREYQNEGASRSDIESFVIELGSKSEMAAGRTSTINGYIINGENDEPLEGAIIYTKSGSISATTDEAGFYTLALPNGKYTLYIQYLGMKPTKREVVLFSDDRLDIGMEVDAISLRGITIESDREVNIESVQMGLSKIDAKEVKNMPVVLGEKDLLKVATTMAGVKTIGEGASGFNIRGGKSDQNLVLLDGSPVYNTSHFFGFFSIFNSDAIESLNLYKSGIPAEHGGRLSSVFEIETRNAEREEVKGIGGISPITTHLTVDIPLKNQTAGLLVSGRTTYSNWVLKRVESASFKNNRVAFNDLLVKYDQDLTENNELSASIYLSKDNFRITSDTLFSYSNFSNTNTLANIGWKHQFSPTMDGMVRLSHSRYAYGLEYDESPPNAFTQDFGINETNLNGILSYYPNDIHFLTGGFEIKSIRIQPGSKSPLGSSLISPISLTQERGLLNTLFISDEMTLNERLTLYGGLRYSYFSAFGPQSVNIYQQGEARNSSTIVRTIEFDKGESIANYHGPEFRVSGRWTLDDFSSVKASYNRTRQYIHALSNSASLSPTDIWRMSNYYIKPQTADQYAVGYYRNFFNNDLETSAEFYYKSLDNLLDFKVAGDFLLNRNVEQVTLQGLGESYGVELSLKKSGKLNGWINYTYARTFLRIASSISEDNINGGKFYPASFDMPHSFNMVANYKLTWRLSFSYNLVYNTGRPVTYPVGIYDYKGVQAVHYANRNSYRIPHYMRMDLGVNLEGGHRKTKLVHSYWSFSVYNLLGRENPYSVFFDIQDGKVSGYQLIIFGTPIPTLTYNFQF